VCVELFDEEFETVAAHEAHRVSKETYYSVKRDLLQCQKRPISFKETYYSVKRELLQCQKRPITASKETYYSVKRDLLQRQKKPISYKRDLLVSIETY
jgi:hypothetical protein